MAQHTETGQWLVLYRQWGTTDKTWARPLTMWWDRVDGEPRFKQVELI